MKHHFKYPRTPHLPWSNLSDPDDIMLSLVDHLETIPRVVVTEKLDGENTTMYTDYYHARSLDSQHHPSRSWVKNLHSQIKHKIPEDIRICGENLYAKHSILYTSLTSFFYVFSVWKGELCLDWDETLEWCFKLGLYPVPDLYTGCWDEKKVKKCYRNGSVFGPEQEGYVVRNTRQFLLKDFQKNVAKYVRPQHVTTDEHWMKKKLVRNILAR